MIKLNVHNIGNVLIALLQFVAVSSPMSLVCVTTPELPAGEAIE